MDRGKQRSHYVSVRRRGIASRSGTCRRCRSPRHDAGLQRLCPRLQSEREGVIEILVERIIQIVAELFGQLLFELGWESFGQSFRDRPRANPVLAGFGYLALGALLGLVLAYVFPVPLSKHEAVTILGVFLNPIGFGLLSHLYGEHRRRRGRNTTNLATFWGGAAFAFGIAAVRAAMVLS